MSPVPGALLLGRREIAALMAPADWLAAAEAAFRAAAEGRAEAPPPLHLAGAGGAFHAKGASLTEGDGRFAAVKLNGNFPANPARGLPTIQGAILLCDGASGALLAILDSIEVTLRRTAAATALAARYLARRESRALLVGGCGAQAPAQLDALRGVLPIAHVFAWDRERGRAEAFARRAGMAVTVLDDPGRAAAASDVIVACTTAAAPWLEPDMVRPGTFVAAVGADSPDKNEIAPALMARARVVTDLTDQCAAMGDLRHALAAGAMRRDDVHAELAELVAGARPGRCDDEEITLFDSTGTALQDVAAAALIHARAQARGDLSSFDLAA